METADIKDRFISKLEPIELFQDKMFESLGKLISIGGGDPLSKKNQTSRLVDTWHDNVSKFREEIENSISAQPRQYQEMLDICTRSCADAPFLRPPALAGLKECLEKSIATNNKIVSGRLESALHIFENAIKSTRDVCIHQWYVTEAACDSSQVTIECLLKLFYRELNSLSIILKQFHNEKLAVDAEKLKKYRDHQQQLAMEYQASSYSEMCKSIKSQSALFKSMMSCLNDELEGIPIKERNKGKKKLDELYKKLQELLIQAEIYYESSHSVILAQSPSTFFYRSIRQWLKEFQSLLIQILSSLLTREPTDDLPSPSEKKLSVDKSALFNYARRLDSGRLIDIASSASFTHPTSAITNELLTGFVQFHLNSNMHTIEKLKKSMDKLFNEYDELKKNVTYAVKMQQKFYTSKDSKLPDISKTDEYASYGSTNPGVVKQLLKLDHELKMADSDLKSKYHTLFVEMGGEYTRLEHQNVKLLEIVEYLKQYGLIMRDWEEKIKQEQIFIQRWRDNKRHNCRQLSELYTEWNFYITDEVETFYRTISLFSVNIFHKIKIIANDFLINVAEIFNKRLFEFESEMKLISALYRDVRSENEACADALTRAQSEFELWVKDTVYLYQVYFEHRLDSVIIYYISALESLLKKFEEADNDLEVLAIVLDNISILLRDPYDAKEHKEEKRAKFLIDSM